MYIKQIMEIGSNGNSIATEDAFGISGEFDIDNLCGTLNFNLPYFIPLPDSTTPQYTASGMLKEGVDITRLKKFDTVRLFYGEFETDPGVIEQTKKRFEVIKPDGNKEIVEENVYKAGGVELKLIFDGFIDTIKLNKSKSSINYEIGALGTLGLANYRNLSYERKEGTAYELILTLLQISGLQQGQFNIYPVERDLIPAYKIRFIDVDAKNRVLITDGGKELKTVLDGLRKKYALIIHQSGDGYINVMTPYFLLSAGSNEFLNVNAWQFDINNGTIYDIDYGDLTQNYNAVVVLGGFSDAGVAYGIAVDPIAVQNNGGHINYLTFENRNLTSDEECQQVARDKLLDMEKNYVITFKTKFHPEFMVGQPFRIIDNDRFTGEETLILKKYSFTIDKNDVSCTVQGFAHGATMIPEDIALQPTGVLDVDILQIREKELDITKWKELA